MPSTKTIVSATIEVFIRDGRYWLLVSGELHGPYRSEYTALQAIPNALTEGD